MVYAGPWLPMRTSFRIPMSRSHCVCTLTLYALGCGETTYAYRAHWSLYCYISFSYSWEIPMESHGNRRISLFAEPAPWTVVTADPKAEIGNIQRAERRNRNPSCCKLSSFLAIITSGLELSRPSVYSLKRSAWHWPMPAFVSSDNSTHDLKIDSPLGDHRSLEPMSLILCLQSKSLCRLARYVVYCYCCIFTATARALVLHSETQYY